MSINLIKYTFPVLKSDIFVVCLDRLHFLMNILVITGQLLIKTYKF